MSLNTKLKINDPIAIAYGHKLEFGIVDLITTTVTREGTTSSAKVATAEATTLELEVDDPAILQLRDFENETVTPLKIFIESCSGFKWAMEQAALYAPTRPVVNPPSIPSRVVNLDEDVPF